MYFFFEPPKTAVVVDLLGVVNSVIELLGTLLVTTGGTTGTELLADADAPVKLILFFFTG